MAFAFHSPRNTDRSLCEVLRERIEKADEHLSVPAPRRAEGIHEARKRFKELRAALRLFPDQKHPEVAALDKVFRDAGRQLSGTRDAQALLECWEKLHDADPEPLDTPFGRAFHTALRRNAAAQLHESGTLAGILGHLRTTLRDHLHRLPEIHAADDGFDYIERGIRRSYRAGRRQLHDTIHDASAEQFHEWRKRVKDHWYHIRMIAQAWPEALEHRQRLFKQLSDQLGDDHDLAVLAGQLRVWPERARQETQRQALVLAIMRRQAFLRREALALGRRLYAEKPRAFTRRIGCYWALWEQDQP